MDYWEVIGLAPPGGTDNVLNEEAHVDVQLDQRHMMLRGENVTHLFLLYCTVTLIVPSERELAVTGRHCESESTHC